MTCAANVTRDFAWSAGQLSTNVSAWPFGILIVYGRGGVHARRSSGLRSMMSFSETAAARATTERSVADGIVAVSYSVHDWRSISSALNPNASGCFVTIAAAMSFGT